MEVTNSTGGDTQLRPPGSTSTTGTKDIPVSKLRQAMEKAAEMHATATTTPHPAPAAPQAPSPAAHAPAASGWTVLKSGVSVKLKISGPTKLQCKAPDGKLLEVEVDAHTERVELVRDRNGGYRAVLTPAPTRVQAPPPKAAAGGRR